MTVVQNKQKSFRLSDLAVKMLARMADHIGVTETAIVEMALREKFRREGYDEAMLKLMFTDIEEIPAAQDESENKGAYKEPSLVQRRTKDGLR